MLIAAILLQAAEAAEDIVMVGRRSCDLSIASKAITGKALDDYAAQWRTGGAVSIVVPPELRIKCLAKVVFRLQDRGVTQVEFEDSPEAGALPADRAAGA